MCSLVILSAKVIKESLRFFFDSLTGKPFANVLACRSAPALGSAVSLAFDDGRNWRLIAEKDNCAVVNFKLGLIASDGS